MLRGESEEPALENGYTNAPRSTVRAFPAKLRISMHVRLAVFSASLLSPTSSSRASGRNGEGLDDPPRSAALVLRVVR